MVNQAQRQDSGTGGAVVITPEMAAAGEEAFEAHGGHAYVPTLVEAIYVAMAALAPVAPEEPPPVTLADVVAELRGLRADVQALLRLADREATRVRSKERAR